MKTRIEKPKNCVTYAHLWPYGTAHSCMHGRLLCSHEHSCIWIWILYLLYDYSSHEYSAFAFYYDIIVSCYYLVSVLWYCKKIAKFLEKLSTLTWWNKTTNVLCNKVIFLVKNIAKVCRNYWRGFLLLYSLSPFFNLSI